MTETRVKIQDIVQNQVPEFVKSSFPLVVEFLREYYKSQEFQGSTYDLINNLDQYLKIDNLTNLELTTKVSESGDGIASTIDFSASSIQVESVYGFPKKYGLIQIDDEIILYQDAVEENNTFTGCIRGFSGITSYKSSSELEIVFTESKSSVHTSGTTVTNLSVLFLTEFLIKVKTQLTPGFENRSLFEGLNENIFIKQSKNFYETKGTDTSFKILFAALYGENVDIIKPKDYLFRPSDAQYQITKDIVVEPIEGNPLDLLNNTLYQDEYTNLGIKPAYGSVTDVETITTANGKIYYKISLDYDYDKDINLTGSVFGDFSSHPKTVILTDVALGASTIDVDSTVGFPNSGILVAEDGQVINYEDKNSNQFLGVSGVLSPIAKKTQISYDVFAYGYSGVSQLNEVRVRILTVLKEFKLNDEKTNLYYEGDTVKIKSLGINDFNTKSTSFGINLPIRSEVISRTIINSENNTYAIKTKYPHYLRIGDPIFINQTNANVISVDSEFDLIIRGQGVLPSNVNLFVEKKILKGNSDLYNISNYITNVQNTYVDFDDNVLVNSGSIPSYFNKNGDEIAINPFNKTVSFSGAFSGARNDELVFRNVTDHGFFTGDAVYYDSFKFVTTEEIPLGDGTTTTISIDEESVFDNIDPGVYYAFRVDKTTIKLARSLSNLNECIAGRLSFISGTGIVQNNTFTKYSLYGKEIKSQNILRELRNPVVDTIKQETLPGPIGILVNGVEILNYKSTDTVYYGEIESIQVSSPGSGYDVINPPELLISDEIGIGATGLCNIKGSFVDIEINDTGFDYIDQPVITITGGNGFGAQAEAVMSKVTHSVSFDSGNLDYIDLTNNIIGFSTYHKFRDNEEVIYKTNGQSALAGLTTGSSYYIQVLSSTSIKIHTKYLDSVSGINTVSLISTGIGFHEFESTNKKQIISDIVVKDSGFGYENKKRVVFSSGIHTASNSFIIKNHNYLDKEIVIYSFDGSSAISGLSTSKKYYVKKVSNDEFKLAEVGIGSTALTYFYDRNIFVNIDTIGDGVHSFNYEPIQVSINGNIGVSTVSGQDFTAKVSPIVKGEVESIQVTASGNFYGSQNILNYNRQPLFTLNSGSGAELLAIVSNGSISEVLVLKEGSGYNSPPSLFVSDSGKYAKLSAVISEGKIVSVKVISGGVGYTKNLYVNIVPSGSGCELYADIKKWTVNNVTKYWDTVTDDDCSVFPSIGDDSLQFYHTYAPRKLRQRLFKKSQQNTTLYGIADLELLSGGNESVSNQHSPIIGWAYDGNPIYGPYGYDTPIGGSARLMKSGYSEVPRSNRPNFPSGFFIDDYQYVGNGDLDENNGRFCITPDFPNGTYAYFATIDTIDSDRSGPFKNFRRPVFPYLIGNYFQSKPNLFNISKNSNQNDLDLNKTNWFRNTYQYRLFDASTGYDYIFNPTSEKETEQVVTIKTSSSGKIDSIGITTSGSNYSVGDTISFINEGTGGFGASAIVSEVLGKSAISIASSSSIFTNVEFANSNQPGRILGFTTSPHNIRNREIISISGISSSIKNFPSSSIVGIRSDSFILNIGIGTTGVTGLTTYFYINGNLNYPFIRENDILAIGTQEKVKVLNVDSFNSRIRVLREYDSTVGTSHSSGTIIFEDPRKFVINSTIPISDSLPYNVEYYFDPAESLGIGTTSGPGITSTINFSNPGAGITQVTIPTQTIYIKNHGLNTNDLLTYSSNVGSGISVSNDGINVFQLLDDQDLYVAKINEDLIGISTQKVGIGSTGVFSGIGTTSTNNLLYFNSLGLSGTTYHSFKTNKDSVVTARIDNNKVTVSTAQTHFLSLNDTVKISTTVGIQTTVHVFFNFYNQRIVFNPRTFESSDVNLGGNRITIQNHGYTTGDKVIHTSSSGSPSLENNGIYYVVVYDENTIRLSTQLYDATSIPPNIVDITSSASGSISLVNPPLKVYKYQNVTFDLSDQSLSFLNGLTRYPAFDLKFYTNLSHTERFLSTKSSSKFEIVKTGEIGKDENANITIQFNEFFPQTLYYKFDPINIDKISPAQRNIITDTEVKSFNQINLIDSAYAGEYVVTGITSTSFSFSAAKVQEKTSYNQAEALVEYKTNSKTEKGPISDIKIISNGKNYKSLPGFSTVSSSSGSNAVLETFTNSIGKIISFQIENIGFDYPSDLTLRPVANLPTILQVDSLTSFESIGVSSVGKFYSLAPELVVIDSVTRKLISDVQLEYEIEQNSVRIVQNTKGISKSPPQIIPINNTNGIGINTITYNSSTKDVNVILNVGFSTFNSFPFSVGDRILVENVSIGIGSTGKNYNSDNYNYNLFTVKSVDENIGGIGSITYNISEYLADGEFPGNFVSSPAASITPEKYFPIFDIKLKNNNFLTNEFITINGTTVEQEDIKIGEVESWDSNTETLKISTRNEFEVGEFIRGNSSGTIARISRETNFKSSFETGPYSVVKKGWRNEVGVLNDNIQRMPNNEYYQYFSYSLKSRVPLQTWNDPVSSLNHTVGFSKFSDLVIESESETSNFDRKNVEESNIEVIVDIISSADLNCIYNFDLVTENSIVVNNKTLSNEIIFDTTILVDYFESVGNRVLIIDDISPQFNSNPRPTKYSVVDIFSASKNVKWYISFARDRRFAGEAQISLLSLMHDFDFAFINQYATLSSTTSDLGSFDFVIAGSEGNLQFFPKKFEVNDYDIITLSYGIDSPLVSTGTSTFGDTVKVESFSTSTSSLGSATNIISIDANTYRTGKFIVEISIDESQYQFEQITAIHDNSEVSIVNYGTMVSNDFDTTYDGIGFGTFNSYISGSDLKIDFTPNVGIGTTVSVNSIGMLIANTSSVGVGTRPLGLDSTYLAIVQSNLVSIASSSSPSQTVICTYPKDYNAAYVLASIENTTNSEYDATEFVVLSTTDTVYLGEFGSVNTYGGTGIGTIGAAINGNNVEVYYTPVPNIDVEVRTYQHILGLLNEDSQKLQSFNVGDNSDVSAIYNTYTGTFSDVRRDFNLTHKREENFRRRFVGSSTSIIDLQNDIIKIPGHFFVTGEQVRYRNSGFFSSVGSGNTASIGIADTTFPDYPGIGATNLLPPSLYIVKVDDNRVKLARTAQDALSPVPKTLNLTSVGIGTSHVFVSVNPNTKSLISIDNVIQSPIVSTSVTTGLTTSMSITDNVMRVTGITSIFGGDLIKIDDEIMLVNTVGFGTTNGILVQRPWMGTILASHTNLNSVITKVKGDYNIVTNNISFITAPYGLTPLSTSTNAPDSRDWEGVQSKSSFSGRVFTRSGVSGSSTDTYSTNYIFKDVSDGFTGIAKTFTLTTASGQNVTGFSTSNAIVVINDVFQTPKGTQSGSENSYELIENSGISSIRFTGAASSVTNDINTSNLPTGGIIVSVGSTKGFGYQPLVSAGGTAIISSGGTVQSINVTRIGSGYRCLDYYEIITSVASTVAIGSTIIPINNLNGVFEKLALSTTNIINVGTGLSEVPIVGYGTTAVFIGIGSTASSQISQNSKVVIRLEDPVAAIVDVGIITSISSTVLSDFVGFTTVVGGHISTSIIITEPGIGLTSSNPPFVVFEDPTSYSDLPLIYSSAGPNGIGTGAQIDLVVGAGTSVIDFTITNNGYAFGQGEILTIPVAGLTGIPREYKGRYVDGANLIYKNRSLIQEEVVGFITATYPGITTNVDYDQEICKRDVGYIVDALAYDLAYGGNFKSVQAGLAYWNAGVSYVDGEATETIAGYMYIIDLAKFIINNVAINTSYQLDAAVGISTLTYDNVSGITTITTVSPHSLVTNDYVVLKDIVLSCDSGSGINTAVFPSLGSGPDGNGPLSPKGYNYQVTVLDSTSFEVNPGPSTISHNYVSDGTVQKSFINVAQTFDASIDYDDDCSPSSYSENCCADVWFAVGNYVGIVTTIIGVGTTAAPRVSSTISRPLAFPITEDFREFQITVDKTFTDKFSAWVLGELQVLDSPAPLFDGITRSFQLKLNNDLVSIRAPRGSVIDVQASLLVFVNDILQIPGEGYVGYIFPGGSVLTFTEAPKPGDTCSILFYKGTGDDIDVVFVDILENVKKGDELTLYQNKDLCKSSLDQDTRLAIDILSTDIVQTNPYSGRGITDDKECKRPVTLCKQTVDKIINGQVVSKDRETYEPFLNPATVIINPIGSATTIAYVENIRPFFNQTNENTSAKVYNTLQIISQEEVVGASATTVVSAAGTITSISIIDGGIGYIDAPVVTIQSPTGIGTTATAIANVSIGGSISSITITNPGTGYTSGPITSLSVYREGIGYPSPEEIVFENANLKNLSGIGRNATVNIKVFRNVVTELTVIDPGSGYSVGDILFVDTFDVASLSTSFRNYPLTQSLQLEVGSIEGPSVLIEPPTLTLETNQASSYTGDSGIIVGFGTTTIGGTANKFVFDLYIPMNSYLRNTTISGTAITVSSLQQDDYFIVSNSNVGLATTSLPSTRNDSTIIGFGTQYVDNVYQVYSSEIIEANVVGVGTTYITRVFANILFPNEYAFDSTVYTFDSTSLTFDTTGITTYSGIITSLNYFGDYSWGKINLSDRPSAKSFNFYGDNGVGGISTSALIRRVNSLRYSNYLA